MLKVREVGTNKGNQEDSFVKKSTFYAEHRPKSRISTQIKGNFPYLCSYIWTQNCNTTGRGHEL